MRGKTGGGESAGKQMVRAREDRWSDVEMAGRQVEPSDKRGKTNRCSQTHIEMESVGRKVRDVAREK